MYAIIERPLRSFVPLLWVVIFAAAYAHAQGQPDPERNEGQADLSAKIEAMTHSIEQMQSELTQSRQEIQQLRDLLGQLIGARSGAPNANANVPEEYGPLRAESQKPEAAPARISEDDWQILNARVEEHEQVKVDSSSKFRLKLSGIVLFNIFDTSGQFDNLDAPTVAVQPPPYVGTGSVGASFRQSILGLRGIGPTVFGARTSADIDMDFLNGAAGPYGGIGSGQVGLRTARVQFDWSNFSATGGLEAPFFSPNTPTSYLSLAVPAFSSAGNLWNWTPQIRAERRFDFTSSEFKLEAGLLDSTGYSVVGSTLRLPTPGESSRQPVYAVRLSGNNRSEDHTISFGVSGTYIPLRFPNTGTISGTGLIADWKFPLPSRLQVSGAFFTGKGLDGFGGLALPAVQAQDYQHFIYITAPTLAAIPVIGGWSQLKFTLNSRSEFNAAAGLGERDARRLRAAAQYDPLLLFVPPTNRSFFFNYIFRPRSDLVFSAEYRRFHTNEIPGESYSAGQIGLAAGFLF